MNIDLLKSVLQSEGEVHVVVEEHESVLAEPDEDYIGFRIGNTSFDDSNEVIVVDDGSKEHYIGYDRVVYFHAPNDFPD